MTITQKTCAAPALDRREILRYAGARFADEALDRLLDDCLDEALPVLTYKVCSLRAPISIVGSSVVFASLSFTSAALAKNLNGCGEAVLFAATVGLGIDRLIARYKSLSPSKSLMLQAIGAERIESLCDTFCDGLEAEGMKLRPRFSPGYGDLDISCQRGIFDLLGCEKRIGVTLNGSMLMSPSKSVTAIVGIL